MLNTADVHFFVGKGDEKKILRAQKAILQNASDVFEAMFRFGDESAKAAAAAGKVPSEEIEPIEVPDVEVGAFEAMLSFIHAGDSSGLNGDNVVAVLCAANKYNVRGLIQLCVHFPKEKLSNVFLAFDQTRNATGQEEFARRCLNYIDVNAEDFIRSNEFLQITQKLLCEILQRDQLFVYEEITIWEAAIFWANVQCRQNGKVPSVENRLAMLGPALFKIRLPLISKEEFSKFIVPSRMLTSDQMMSVFLHHCHPDHCLPDMYPLQFPNKGRIATKLYRSVKVAMLTIEKLSEFAGEDDNSRRLGKAVYLYGLSWKILAVLRTDEFGEKFVDFSLLSDAQDAGPDWFFATRATLKIVSQKKGEDFSVLRHNVFSYNATVFLIQSMCFEELMKPKNGWYDEAKDTVVLEMRINLRICHSGDARDSDNQD